MLEKIISLSPDIEFVPLNAYCDLQDMLISSLTNCSIADNDHDSHFCNMDCIHFCSKNSCCYD